LLKLILATNNQGKVKEYRALLKLLPVELVTPREINVTIEVAETGSTYVENARLKALTLAKVSQLVSLADDSGLEVDALDGEPGVRSSRYAGNGASDEGRIKHLLRKLEGVPLNKRTARFVCVIAIATPEGKIEICTGECAGQITLEPRGDSGFGYDPVFLLPEFGKTMAELPMSLKNQVSHRYHATRQVPEVLRKLDLIKEKF
jgi:XTP/dITP diphosphohydrolase